MTPCLIKPVNIKGFTLVEILMAVAFSVLLLTGVYGFYNASSQSYTSGITGQTLQDAADIVLSKIIEGKTESGVVYRLATAVSYMIPNGTVNAMYHCGGAAQVSPCQTGNPYSELYYCQDSTCSSTDATARWYYLNSTGNAVVYHHPQTGGGTIDETIYTAPEGSTLNLRFSPAVIGSPVAQSPIVVEIDVALNQNLLSDTTNNLLTRSGAASTFVLLRNHT